MLKCLNVKMILLVGLGNPGEKFQKTRHNLGFRVIDELREKNDFPDFRLSKKSNALISEGVLDGEKILLAKPQTFMNNSGKSVKKITSNIEHRTSNLFIVHDDIDLPLGKIKIVKNRGAAGHKGVESIIKELGAKNFVRFRLGIKPNSKFKMQNSKSPRTNSFGILRGKQLKTQNFVLMKFAKEEQGAVKEIIERAVEAIEVALKEGVEKTMNLYNK